MAKGVIVSTRIDSILQSLDDFEKTPESVGFDLRLSLSDLILKHLHLNGWTQKQLADESGMKEPSISRILNSDTNCTLDTAGRLLHALGVWAHLEEGMAHEAVFAEPETLKFRLMDETHGEETFQNSESAVSEITIFKAQVV